MGTSQLNKKTTTNNKKCRKYQVSQCQLGSTFIKNSFKPIISHFLGNLQLSTPTNSNEDYGGHHKTLNFPKQTISRYIDHQQDSSIRISAKQRFDQWKNGNTVYKGKLVIPDGSRSFGLVRDK